MPEDDGGGVALDDLGDIRRVCSPKHLERTAKAMGVFKFNTSILNKAIESNIIIAPSFSSPSRDVEPAAVTSDRVSAGMLTSATEKVAVRSQTCMLCGLQGSSDNTTLFCQVFSVTPPPQKRRRVQSTLFCLLLSIQIYPTESRYTHHATMSRIYSMHMPHSLFKQF